MFQIFLYLISNITLNKMNITAPIRTQNRLLKILKRKRLQIQSSFQVWVILINSNLKLISKWYNTSELIQF